MSQSFDRRSVLGLAVGSAAGVMFVSSARPTYAAGTAYKATLDGASEVPPTTSTLPSASSVAACEVRPHAGEAVAVHVLAEGS